MIMKTNECPICKNPANGGKIGPLEERIAYFCPHCGRFELATDGDNEIVDDSRTASFLYHHYIDADEDRYFTTLDSDGIEKERAEKRYRGTPIHLDIKTIDDWYPKTFAERVDKILILLNRKSRHVGERLRLSQADLIGLLFIDRKEFDSWDDTTKWRDPQDCKAEMLFMLNYLKDSGLVSFSVNPTNSEEYKVVIQPTGYKRIEEIQRYNSNGRNAFIAMQFGKETIPLREAIKAGIRNAGYCPVLIDEIEHIEFIIPELLKHIRESKFVVVDLSNNNNGAYFEEGYAMGLGKPVIQLCRCNVKMHFDISQKNTIMWENEDEVAEKLYKRIKATIE